LVSIGIIIAGVLAFAFFASGGLKTASAFLGSDFSGERQKEESGQVTTDSLQQNPTIPIPQGSQTTVATIQASQIIRSDISSKRKFNVGSEKPMIRTAFFNPKEGGSEPQAGFTKTSANISGGFKFGQLTTEQVGSIRAQPFTEQEQQDIQALTTRFAKKSTKAQRVSDSPEEIVLKKREQAFIAQQILGGSNFVKSGGIFTRGGNLIEVKGGLFGSAGFALGGVSRETFLRQQRDKALIDLKIAENRALAVQQEKTGRQIISTIKKSGMNQSQFLLNQGIALRGGNLNARALGKLQASGVFNRARIKKEVEAVPMEKAPLTSMQVQELTDAEKVARFRAGERFT